MRTLGVQSEGVSLAGMSADGTASGPIPSHVTPPERRPAVIPTLGAPVTAGADGEVQPGQLSCHRPRDAGQVLCAVYRVPQLPATPPVRAAATQPFHYRSPPPAEIPALGTSPAKTGSALGGT